MGEEDLIDIILKLKEWHKSKVEQFNQIIKLDKDQKIMFDGGNGKQQELSDKDRNGFVLGFSVALEILGEFPVKIEKPSEEDEEQ